MTQPRLRPLHFRNGKTARNRIVIPPMASQTADADGFATPETWAHYARLGEAGAGLIFVEYSYVHPTGKGEPRQLGAHSSAQVPGLTRIAESLHAAGALAGLQLVHVGGKTTSALTGHPLMGPSAIPVPVKGRELETPTPMNAQDIQNWSDWFLEAARRAEAAGFDIVELHAAHGYGLNQWLSPLTNRRDDAYGGGIEGRNRLLLDLVARLKREVPGLLLAVRLPAQDHLPGGLEPVEMAWVARQLEVLGIDLLDVSSGLGGWRRPAHREAEGYLVDDAAFLKAHVSIPVIGVGGIESADYVDHILNEKYVNLAAVGRAILRDPAAWGRQNLNGVLSCTV
ncbi:MAG: NADH:flavin oxidoreductase [Bdellovibrionaceae bacterium]|nr:NADH:flavin oxidoreductase [Pseudobdellovibrionaceae bacterium]